MLITPDRSMSGLLYQIVHMANSARWMRDGACRTGDAELWFPPTGQTGHAAKKICNGCPVVAECLTYALENPDLLGVWGATTWEDRKEIRMGRRLKPRADRVPHKKTRQAPADTGACSHQSDATGKGPKMSPVYGTPPPERRTT